MLKITDYGYNELLEAQKCPYVQPPPEGRCHEEFFFILKYLSIDLMGAYPNGLSGQGPCKDSRAQSRDIWLPVHNVLLKERISKVLPHFLKVNHRGSW